VQELKELQRQGVSIQAISKLTGWDRKTIRKYLQQANARPDYGPRKRSSSKLDAFKPYLEERMRAGVWNARVLLRELQQQNYSGGYTILKGWLQPQRSAARTVAVRRFETPPGKHYGECRVMVRSGEGSVFWTDNLRRLIVDRYIILLTRTPASR
jgi:transposase